MPGSTPGGSTRRIEYANDEACTNQAESYFARLRRGEMGHHHRISGVYLAFP